MRIPKNIRIYFGKTEIKKSLNTYDYELACIKANIIYNHFNHITKVARMAIVSPQQIQELVDKFILETLQQDKIDRADKQYGIEGVCYDPIEYLNYMIHECREYLAVNNYSPIVDDAKKLLTSVGIDFNASDPSHKLFQQTLLRGQITVFEEALNRVQGIYSSKFDIRGSNQNTPVEVETKFIYTYTHAYDEFKIYYNDNKVSQSTKDDTFRVLDKLLAIVGAETAISNTKLTDLIKIKQRIENLPNLNYAEYKNMSFEEILQLTNIPEKMKITDSRAKDYIKHIKKFFTFCYQNRIVDFDPAVDLNISVDSDKKDPFSNEEANALFKIFDTQAPFARLLLYIYPFTGMRREEPYNSSILEEDGIKYFYISDGKNSYAKRKIPLHKKLLELGIDDDSFTKAKNKISYTTLAKLFNQKLKPQVTMNNRYTLHSWRHTVATKLQHAEVVDSVIQNILGHSSTDTLNKVYAREKTNLIAIQHAINKISYDDYTSWSDL